MLRPTPLFALLLSFWLLTGCGVKGGLTLPPDEPPSANDSTSQA